MKKTSIWITLAIVAATTAMTVLSQGITLDNPSLDLGVQAQEAYLNALADDVTLKEIIRFTYDISSHSYSRGSMIGDIQRFAEDAGRERVIKAMGEMIREYLSIIQENANNPNSHIYMGARHNINHLIIMLEGLPGNDTLIILRECLQSKSEGTRDDARRTAQALGVDLDATDVVQAETPDPDQPPEATAATATVENILPPADTVETPSSNVPITTTQPPPEPDATKSVPWKLPLLIGIVVLGAIAAWCRLKGKP